MTSSPCPFCDVPPDRIADENAHAIAIRDRFPVNPGHTLVIPRRHVESWFGTSPEERIAIFDLIDEVHRQLDTELRPDGYNIGVNVGTASGQTVMHLHVHVIPRFSGDVDDPAGGVRFVLPARGDYRQPGRVPTLRR